METIKETELEQLIEGLTNEEKKQLRTTIFFDCKENANMNLGAKNKISLVIKSFKLLGISMGKKAIINQKIADLPPAETFVNPDLELDILQQQAIAELEEKQFTEERKMVA